MGRSQVMWTVAGAGAGFGVGLWAGLAAFDDSVDSDRKVWTTAIVSAGVGGVAGYLIGRSRKDRTHPLKAANAMYRSRQEAAERRSLEQLAKSVRFRSATPSALLVVEEDVPRLAPMQEIRHENSSARRTCPQAICQIP